jgi:uncharacterized membrane protein YoaK (UPF0700 family)
VTIEEPATNREPARAPGWFKRNLPALAFTGLALAIWALIMRDFGTGWDETVELAYGEAVREYFRTFDYVKLSAFPVANRKYYCPATDLICASLAHATGQGLLTFRHPVNGLFWAATFWPICSLGTIASGRFGGWLAGVALLGMPAYLGHGFINAKDGPTACAVAWVLWGSVWAVGRRTTRRVALVLGAVAGGLLMTRPGAWFLTVIMLVPLAVNLWTTYRDTQRMPQPKDVVRVAGHVGLVVAIAWTLMISLWPYAHQSPIMNPIRAMNYARKFDEGYAVLYQARVWQSDQLPWHYMFGYFVLTTPLPILLCSLLGQGYLGAQCLSAKAAPQKRGLMLAGMFVIWFPLVAFIVLRPNVYDGLRHFLFVLPVLALFAGIGGAAIAEIAARKERPGIAAALAVILLGMAIPWEIRLHPYQYVYYNLLAGDPRTLHQRYETDYWVTSFREAASWIASQPALHDRPRRVAVAANQFSLPALADHLPPGTKTAMMMGDFRNTRWVDAADYYVATVRYGQWRNFPAAPILFTVERDGILLAVVRGAPPEPAP